MGGAVVARARFAWRLRVVRLEPQSQRHGIRIRGVLCDEDLSRAPNFIITRCSVFSTHSVRCSFYEVSLGDSAHEAKRLPTPTRWQVGSGGGRWGWGGGLRRRFGCDLRQNNRLLPNSILRTETLFIPLLLVALGLFKIQRFKRFKRWFKSTSSAFLWFTVAVLMQLNTGYIVRSEFIHSCFVGLVNFFAKILHFCEKSFLTFVSTTWSEGLFQVNQTVPCVSFLQFHTHEKKCKLAPISIFVLATSRGDPYNIFFSNKKVQMRPFRTVKKYLKMNIDRKKSPITNTRQSRK